MMKIARSVNRIVLACLSVGGMAFAANALAATMTYNIQNDTVIDGKYPTDKLGSSVELDMYLNGSAKTNSNPSRALLEMPDVVVPGGMAIQSVTLKLYCCNYNKRQATEDLAAAVYPLLTSFDEGSANWIYSHGSTPWTHPGGDYDTSITATDTITGIGDWATLDLTGMWGNPNVQDHGVLIAYTPEDPSSVKPTTDFYKLFFNSSEAGSNKPYIEVAFTAIPEPATSVLLLAAGTGIAASWRRSKRLLDR